MTDISTVFDHVAEDLAETMGVSATYTPAVGDAVTLDVLLNQGVQMQPGPLEAQVWQQGTTIDALLDDLGKEPDRDETITIGSTTYTVLSIAENDGTWVKIIVR